MKDWTADIGLMASRLALVERYRTVHGDEDIARRVLRRGAGSLWYDDAAWLAAVEGARLGRQYALALGDRS